MIPFRILGFGLFLICSVSTIAVQQKPFNPDLPGINQPNSDSLLSGPHLACAVLTRPFSKGHQNQLDSLALGCRESLFHSPPDRATRALSSLIRGDDFQNQTSVKKPFSNGDSIPGILYANPRILNKIKVLLGEESNQERWRLRQSALVKGDTLEGLLHILHQAARDTLAAGMLSMESGRILESDSKARRLWVDSLLKCLPYWESPIGLKVFISGLTLPGDAKNLIFLCNQSLYRNTNTVQITCAEGHLKLGLPGKAMNFAMAFLKNSRTPQNLSPKFSEKNLPSARNIWGFLLEAGQRQGSYLGLEGHISEAPWELLSTGQKAQACAASLASSHPKDMQLIALKSKELRDDNLTPFSILLAAKTKDYQTAEALAKAWKNASQRKAPTGDALFWQGFIALIQGHWREGDSLMFLASGDMASPLHERALQARYALLLSEKTPLIEYFLGWPQSPLSELQRLEQLAKILPGHPLYAAARLERGLLLFAREDFVSSLADLEIAQKNGSSPEKNLAWRKIQLIHEAMGNPQKSIAEYRRHLLESPQGINAEWSRSRLQDLEGLTEP